jgi:hypothetical protein
LRGAALTAADVAAYAADPEHNGSKVNPFTFNKRIYGHESVKRALRRAQHSKCCYCEGYFAGQAAGDVEHYRPKACVQQEPGGPNQYPGYYWLAYDWANLYYVCEQCNRVGKRNLFPLVDPARRARRPDDPVTAETPMIIDPGGTEDPRDHIRFRGPVPFGITNVGRATIALLRLDRTDLTTARLHHLKLLKLLRLIASGRLEAIDQGVAEEREDARRELDQAAGPEGIYSAMAQDFLQA